MQSSLTYPQEEPIEVIKLLIENGRPITILAPIIIVSLHYFYWLPTIDVSGIINYIVLIFGVTSLRMGINNVNNVYDLENDKINKPHRPIPRGELEKDTAFITGLVIQFLSLFAFMLISISAFLLCLSFVVLGWLYNIEGGLKNYFPVNNLIIGYVRGFGYLLAVASAGVQFNEIHIIFAFAITLYIFGSINSKDINDVEGDLKENRQTLPIILGRNNHLLAYISAPFIFTPVIIVGILQLIIGLPMFAWLLYLIVPLNLTILYFMRKSSTTDLVENNVAWLFMILTYLLHHILFIVYLDIHDITTASSF